MTWSYSRFLPLTLIVFVVSFVFFGSNQENKLGNNSIYSVKDLFSFVSKTLEEEKVKQACLKLWWAWTDSNCRPHDYQSCALTS